MIKNYVKIALRHILKYKGYSFINIVGLAIGMAVCVLILLYVRDELSFDGYHAHAERIYRLERSYRFADGSIQPYFCTLAPSFLPLLKKEIPGIEYAARLFGPTGTLVKVGENGFTEDRLYYAEEDIFDVFTIPLIKGNPETALIDPGGIVLSRSMSRKYFGEKDPMGLEMEIDNRLVVQVTGVMQDPFPNSHIHMDFLVSYLSLKGLSGEGEDDYFLGTRNFSDNVTLAYVRLAENTSPEFVQQKIPGSLDRHIPAREDEEGNLRKASDVLFIHMRRVKDIHLFSHLTNEIEPNSNISYVVLFTAVAVLILIIACINFLNLSTARASHRAREVGLRKVVGADRRGLSGQFLGESLVICMIAVLISIGLVMAALPYFRDFSGHEIVPRHLFSPVGMLILIGVFILSGLAAGIYPALYISAFQPVTILRGEFGSGLKGRTMRKVLVVFQFAMTTALIFAVYVVNKQMLFIRNADLGYERENILMVPADREVKDHWLEFKREMLRNPNVLAACLSKRAPTGRLVDSPGFTIEIDGEEKKSPFGMPHNRVSHDFFKTYDMEILAGRDFSLDFATDAQEAFILNETAVRRLGIENLEDVIDAPFSVPGWTGRVIGVVKDFNYESMRDEIKPIVTYIVPRQVNTLSLRLAKGNIRETIGHIETVWARFHPGYPLEYTFLNDRLNRLYLNEERMLRIFRFFSILAVIIGCLGLFGLASFTAEQRTKEIGIRKVLGATSPKIMLLLSFTFIKWVLIANLIAWPAAYFVMGSWLKNFAYKIDIGIAPFILSSGLALAIALITVTYRSVKAAIADPVDALRYE